MLIYSKMKGSTDVFPLVIFFWLRPANSAETIPLFIWSNTIRTNWWQLKLSQFGIPQGSILRPMIFNLYISDLQDNLDLSTFCAQFADDTSLYTQCAVRELESTTCNLYESLTKLGPWSKDSNLALNPNKTKFMVLFTQQTSSHHKLADRALKLTVRDNSLERVESTKFLGVDIHSNLKWDNRVKHLAASCYGTLATLKKKSRTLLIIG